MHHPGGRPDRIPLRLIRFGNTQTTKKEPHLSMRPSGNLKPKPYNTLKILWNFLSAEVADVLILKAGNSLSVIYLAT